MQNSLFVTPEKMENLEQYAAALLTGMISLQTLAQFHLIACKKGILADDQQAAVSTICWEIKRLLALYKTQLESVMEITNITEESIKNSLHGIVTNEVCNLPQGINPETRS